MPGCGKNVQNQFEALTKLANSYQKITLEQINKWLTDAKLMSEKIKPEDTKSCFDKFKSETIDFATFHKFLHELSERKGIPISELEEKLAPCM
ncbi:TPPP family protein CG45057-like Protein [Tribolium castaneum]|uniref:TPPP family protein CG45057-like Protein n=1 Tax=Tribolium castaneum TaxID=7070 RepID=D6WBV3_TRICA|nr:PREDICTED: TPPP family protein CG45057 [Tribolium castaneum]EEZ98749.1 TPPP family protein CG45057-like Protein [Tribolium castaneum]|eukprot:XP_008190366.1 PREDICTED: TPPP family protein CG45057 [Tribolium castaneum]